LPTDEAVKRAPFSTIPNTLLSVSVVTEIAFVSESVAHVAMHFNRVGHAWTKDGSIGRSCELVSMIVSSPSHCRSQNLIL
jgi:hypothetical protein